MSIKVSVVSTITRNMSGIGKTSGKAYNLEFQTVYCHLIGKDGKPAPFPEKIELILDRDEKGLPIVYQPGEYLLHPASLYVDRQGSLAVAPRLAPITTR